MQIIFTTTDDSQAINLPSVVLDYPQGEKFEVSAYATKSIALTAPDELKKIPWETDQLIVSVPEKSLNQHCYIRPGRLPSYIVCFEGILQRWIEVGCPLEWDPVNSAHNKIFYVLPNKIHLRQGLSYSWILYYDKERQSRGILCSAQYRNGIWYRLSIETGGGNTIRDGETKHQFPESSYLALTVFAKDPKGEAITTGDDIPQEIRDILRELIINASLGAQKHVGYEILACIKNSSIPTKLS